GWPMREYPNDEGKRVKHETIYCSLLSSFVVYLRRNY
ncbi:MAG: hypothetical protein ACI9RO_002212, partial [Alteromonas macleodii]